MEEESPGCAGAVFIQVVRPSLLGLLVLLRLRVGDSGFADLDLDLGDRSLLAGIRDRSRRGRTCIRYRGRSLGISVVAVRTCEEHGAPE